LVDDDGHVTNVALAHVDPRKVEMARSLRRRFPPSPDAPTGVLAVARSGRSELVADITDAMVVGATNDPELRGLLRDLGLRSAMTVPLMGRGRPLGAITLVTSESGRHYDEGDLQFAEALGVRAGLSIENARLLAAEQEARARAEGVEARLAAVSEASRALAQSLDLPRTLRAAADLATQHLADSAAVYLEDERGGIRGMAFSTRDPARRDALARFQELYAPEANPGSHVLKAFTTGRTELIGRVELDAVADQVGGEAGEILRTLHIRSSMSVPLVILGRAVGVLGLAWHESEPREPLNVPFAEELARRMARAIENARLYEAERRANERLTLVSRVTSLLSQSLDYESGLQQLAALVTEDFADFCLLDMVEGDGSVRRLAAIHTDPAKQRVMEALKLRPPAMDGNVPAAIAMRTQAVVQDEVREDVLASIAEDDAHLEQMRQIGGVNFVALPLLARGRVLGALTISSTRRRYEDDDVAVAREIAARAAVHLDNLWLYAAQAKAARQAARLQAVVDAVFVAEDQEGLLHELLRRIVRELGTELAAILLMDETGQSLRMRASIGLEEELRNAVNVPYGRGFAGRIAAGRKPLVVNDISAFDVVSSNLGDRVSSAAGVPLIVGEELVGVLHTSSVSPRTFDDDDIALLQLAAERAAVTIRRNELFDRQREIATLLQRSLLPSELPTIPGVEVAALFVAAGRGIDVGGDFYDAFAIDDATWGFAVGDVCGRGPHAAGLTGLARNALRTLALRERDPAAVLAGVNETMLRSEVDRFCTCAYGVVEPSTDGARVILARGGHPTPRVVHPDGGVVEVRPAGPLLGVFGAPEFSAEVVQLMPGDLLVLFTDGLVERNERMNRAGGLRAVLASCAGRPAAAVVDRLRQVVAADDVAPDDVVALVLRVRPPKDEPPSGQDAGVEQWR
jgi:GAF domain-containing protein